LGRKIIHITLLIISCALIFSCTHSTVIANNSSAPQKGVQGTSVPAIPNESLIQGIVSGYCIVSSHLLNISPEQVIYKITVFIESTENVKDLPNLLKAKEGQEVIFYTKERYSSDIFGKKIRAKARLKGDQRSKTYWISDIKIIN
jgi:hypothetical protein